MRKRQNRPARRNPSRRNADMLPIVALVGAGVAAYSGMLGPELKSTLRGLFGNGDETSSGDTGGNCPGPNDGELVLASENAPGTTIKPLYLWTGGQLRHVTTEAAGAALRGRPTRTDIPQHCIDKLPKGANLTEGTAARAPDVYTPPPPQAPRTPADHWAGFKPFVGQLYRTEDGAYWTWGGGPHDGGDSRFHYWGSIENMRTHGWNYQDYKAIPRAVVERFGIGGQAG